MQQWKQQILKYQPNYILITCKGKHNVFNLPMNKDFASISDFILDISWHFIEVFEDILWWNVKDI